ncbi:MAG: hypothetical protein PHQ98_04720 [Candidatus ainarchaeum sp.]|nr:hypothetical protein [Candidatus ainarchaeum sp.]
MNSKLNKFVKGQGTIEYLVLVAVIIIIALIAVVLIVGIPGSAETSSKGDEISSASKEIGVLNALAKPDGNYLIGLKNNTGSTFEVRSISINGFGQYFSNKNNLAVGAEKNFLIISNEPCTTGTTMKFDVNLSFLRNGVTVNVVLPASFKCTNFALGTDELNNLPN